MKKWPVALGALALGLAACGGGGNSGTLGSAVPTGAPSSLPTATSEPTATAALPAMVVADQGDINGAKDAFTPTSGNTASGGSGANIDGMSCEPTMSNTFHVHSFLGILVGGNWVAVPTAIGMVSPGAPVNGFVNSASCFYFIHTHDSSGIIHQESPTSASLSSSEFTLANVADVWGEPLSSTGFGPWSGAVRVFVGNVPLGTQEVNSYTEFTGDPRTIPLYSHTAIWLEVGGPYVLAPQLPPVKFYTQY